MSEPLYSSNKIVYQKTILNQRYYYRLLLISQVFALIGCVIYLFYIINIAGSFINIFLIGAVLRNELLIGAIEIPIFIRILS